MLHDIFNLKNKSNAELIAMKNNNSPNIINSKSTLTYRDMAIAAEAELYSRKKWYETFSGKVIVGVIIGLILIVATIFINRYFNQAPQQQQSQPQVQVKLK